MTVSYLHLRPETLLPDLAVRPFRAVIVADESVSELWRKQVTVWLVDKGCLYACAWGVDCEAWHDSVDRAHLETFDYGAEHCAQPHSIQYYCIKQRVMEQI